MFKFNSTVIPISKFYALVFGGNTYTFKRYKTKLMSMLNKSKSEVQNQGGEKVEGIEEEKKQPIEDDV